MTIVSSEQDRDALTLTFVVELTAPPARVWQIWADPRQLERWWGPPTWPATFEQHVLEVGGMSTYSMTGPEGEKARGWRTLLSVDEPRGLEFEDGFCDESGVPDRDMPTTSARVDLAEISTGTRMTIVYRFTSVKQMEQLAAIGMVEGMTEALGQIDAIVAEG